MENVMKRLSIVLALGTVACLAGFALQSTVSANTTRSMNGGGPSVSWCDSPVFPGSLCATLRPFSGSRGLTLDITLATSGRYTSAVQYQCANDSVPFRGVTRTSVTGTTAGDITQLCPNTQNLIVAVGLIDDL
jgi:hypothetical protein